MRFFLQQQKLIRLYTSAYWIPESDPVIWSVMREQKNSDTQICLDSEDSILPFLGNVFHFDLCVFSSCLNKPTWEMSVKLKLLTTHIWQGYKNPNHIPFET